MEPSPTECARRRIDFWIRVALAVAAFAPFAGTLFYGYVYDDTAIVLRNPVIHGWGSLLEVWKHPYWSSGGADQSGLYRPVTTLIFAVLWNGAHKFAIAFHFFVVVMHTIATLLLWRLLRRAVGRWAAAGAALWFAVHPVHVEAVANIANSSEVLVAVWTVLLVLLLLPRPGQDAPPSAIASPGWGRAICAALLYAAALLTKESGAVALVLALLAVWGWHQPDESSSRRSRGTVSAWMPMLSLWAAVIVIITIVRRVVLGGLVGASSIAAPGIEGLRTVDRIRAMLSLGGRVGELLIWPTVQNPHYGPSALSSVGHPWLVTALTVAVLMIAIGTSGWAAWRSVKPDRRPFVAVMWSLIAFVPASNLFTATGQVLAERTLYVSSMGVALLLAWVLHVAFASAAARSYTGRRGVGRIGAGLAAAMLAVACVRGFIHTRGYAAVWRDQKTLFAHMVRADSLSYRGYQLLAIDAKNHKEPLEAARLYARAYSLYPDDVTLLTDYGEFLLETNRPVDALGVAQRLFTHVEIQTGNRQVTLLLNATSRVWGLDSTLAAARRLHAHAPSGRAALFIGMSYELMHDTPAALAAYRDGLRLAPRDSALATRAAALEQR